MGKPQAPESSPPEPHPRRSLEGVDAIEAALDRDEPVRVLLVAGGDAEGAAPHGALVERAEARGVRIWRGSQGDLRRMSRGPQPAQAIAVLGEPPTASLAELMARGGCVWLLSQATYPSNVGFTVRTAEVAGAQGVVVDAAFNHADRSRARHVCMGADRVMPVLWESTERALQEARAAGRMVVGLEDSGSVAPWQLDLTRPVLFLVGSERDGIDAALASRCDHMVRIPMAGFVPSYNLQAAVTALAVERLRQLER